MNTLSSYDLFSCNDSSLLQEIRYNLNGVTGLWSGRF